MPRFCVTRPIAGHVEYIVYADDEQKAIDEVLLENEPSEPSLISWDFVDSMVVDGMRYSVNCKAAEVK